MAKRTLLRNGLLLDGTGAGPVENAAVVIEGDRIAWVGSSGEVADNPSTDTTVIEARGKAILPGLIDIHVHLCMGGHLLTEFELEAISDAEMALIVLGKAQAALRAGLTTLRDAAGKGMVTLAVRDAINRSTVIGPRLVTCGQGITITGGHGQTLSLEADDEAEVRKAARWLLAHGADYIKLFTTGGNSTLSSNPALAQYSVAEIRAVVEEAARVGKHVAAHAHGTPGIRNAAEAGVGSIEHCLWMAPDGSIAYDEEVAGLIVERCIPVSLAIPLRWRTTSEEVAAHLNPRQRAQRQLVEARLASIRRMREAGMKLVASSDAGTIMTRAEDMPLLLSYLVSQVGMSVPEAVHAASGRPSEVIGLGSEIGTLERGKIADLVLVDGDPTSDVMALRDVELVFRNGRVVSANGLIATPEAA